MDNAGIGGVLTAVVVGTLVTIAGVVVAKLCGHDESAARTRENPSGTGTLARPAETRVRFAAVVKAQQLRETGQSPDMAAMLFSNASMRWTGTDTRWNDNTKRMAVQPLSECPAEDGKDVIVTFASSLPESEIPTNRLTTRSWLKDAATKGKLDFSGLYDCPLALNPTRYGFKEG